MHFFIFKKYLSSAAIQLDSTKAHIHYACYIRPRSFFEALHVIWGHMACAICSSIFIFHACKAWSVFMPHWNWVIQKFDDYWWIIKSNRQIKWLVLLKFHKNSVLKKKHNLVSMGKSERGYSQFTLTRWVNEISTEGVGGSSNVNVGKWVDAHK